MKNEFNRFNLSKIGLLVIILEFLGATGLLLGLKFGPEPFFYFQEVLPVDLILNISSLGLSLLMLCGFIVRLKLRDTIWIALPAVFYMILNAYIFFAAP